MYSIWTNKLYSISFYY